MESGVGISAILLEKDGCPGGGWGVSCSSATLLVVPWGSHYDAFCKVLTPHVPQVQQLN